MSTLTAQLQDIGTRYKFRYVDGIMFSTIIPAGDPDPEPQTSNLVEVGTTISFKKLKPTIHIPVLAA